MARLMFGVAALFFGSAAFAPALQGASSCDLLIQFTPPDLLVSCPKQDCAMCGSAPNAKIQGQCVEWPSMVGGLPAKQCHCQGGAGASEDTCYAQAVFDPKNGTVVTCFSNPRPDCDCPPGLIQPPRGRKCLQVTTYPTDPTQVCQCVGGDETFDN